MYSYQITLLWFFFGIVSWLVGRMSLSLPGPNIELLSNLGDKKGKIITHPPKWAIILCAIPNRKREIADPFSLQMQLGGFVLMAVSGFAGFLVTPTSLVLGIFISVFLYYTLSSAILRKWFI